MVRILLIHIVFDHHLPVKRKETCVHSCEDDDRAADASGREARWDFVFSFIKFKQSVQAVWNQERNPMTHPF